MPYFIRDPKRDPKFDNHPHELFRSLCVGIVLLHRLALPSPLLTRAEIPETDVFNTSHRVHAHLRVTRGAFIITYPFFWGGGEGGGGGRGGGGGPLL